MIVESPLQDEPEPCENSIGCRVIKKTALDSALEKKDNNYSPSYTDLKFLLDDDYRQPGHTAGWRLEYFVSELMSGCKEGLIDDSPDFEALSYLMSRKTGPIAASISITIDLRE